MFELSYLAFITALSATGLAFVTLVGGTVAGFRQPSLVQTVPAIFAARIPAAKPTAGSRSPFALVVLATISLTLALAVRGGLSGHAPFSNMFEFSLAFAWGALVACIYFELRYHTRTLTLFVSPVVVGLLAYATTVPDTIEPLPPALQNNLLLTVHVAVAILAYAAFTVAFAAGILYLIQRNDRLGWLPRSVVLDEIGYKAVMVGFPMLALAIILGAVWADIAWGTYWSWDPKETAALGTWLIYGGYLHARVIRGWRGDRSALFLVGGFAATLFTYYGNLFLGGLHSYA